MYCGGTVDSEHQSGQFSRSSRFRQCQKCARISGAADQTTVRPNVYCHNNSSRTILSADFDGDGVEDVVIAADSDDPMPDSYEYKYQVSDPYNSFFGFGDPRQTANMSHYDPGHTHDLLIIFGRRTRRLASATPKAKFVLINVPFDSFELGRLLIKKNKPPIFVVKVQEARLIESTVFLTPRRSAGGGSRGIRWNNQAVPLFSPSTTFTSIFFLPR